ncbi:hypothetical protein HDK77DRAFT_148625 [Phyllosticta capitalensis]
MRLRMHVWKILSNSYITSYSGIRSPALFFFFSTSVADVIGPDTLRQPKENKVKRVWEMARHGTRETKLEIGKLLGSMQMMVREDAMRADFMEKIDRSICYDGRPVVWLHGEKGSNTDDEVHELHSDHELSETREHQSTRSAQNADFNLDLDPSKPCGQQSSFASFVTLPAHAGLRLNSEMLDESNAILPEAAFDSGSPYSRPSLVRGISAPSLLN